MFFLTPSFMRKMMALGVVTGLAVSLGSATLQLQLGDVESSAELTARISSEVVAISLNHDKNLVDPDNLDLLKTLAQRIGSLDGVEYAAVAVNGRISFHTGVRHGWAVQQLVLPGISAGDPPVTLEVQTVRKHSGDHVALFLKLWWPEALKAGFIILILLAGQYLFGGLQLTSLAGQIRRRKTITQQREPFSLPAGHVDDDLQVVVDCLNVFQDKALEAAAVLAKNESQLLLFFDTTVEAIIGVDKSGTCTFANDALLALLRLQGYKEVIGSSLEELFILDVPGETSGSENTLALRKSIEEGRSFQYEDIAIVCNRGLRCRVSLRCYPVLADGHAGGSIIFLNDNRERMRLLHDRMLLSEAIRQIPMMIVIADDEGKITYVNHYTEIISGFSADEITRMKPMEFGNHFMKDDKQRAQINRTLQAGKAWEGMIETHGVKGQKLNLYAIISPIIDGRGKHVSSVALFREVSYELMLQNELINTKKMEALGRLMSSFAYEFGNPLFGIRSVIRDIAQRPQLKEDDKKLLELAHQECERMRRLVREFQQQYHQRASESQANVAVLVTEVLQTLEPLMHRYNVRYEVNLSVECFNVTIKKNSFSEALYNVVLNGIEAMADAGGILKIDNTLDELFLILRICDQGKGIDREFHELIFEPFFSTKTLVEGAGLGLSVAFGLLKSLGGKITFVSDVGRGSEFFLHIPLEK